MQRRAWGSSLVGVLFLVMSALPASAQITGTVPTSGATATRATTVSAPTTFESNLLMHINNRRAAIGCVRLAYNSHLASAARMHTSRMITAQTLSHQLPRESSLGVRITNAGYLNWRLAAENLAYGPTTSWDVYKLWMGSSGHRANIQNCTLQDAGIGAAFSGGRSWDTIDFGRR